MRSIWGLCKWSSFGKRKSPRGHDQGAKLLYFYRRATKNWIDCASSKIIRSPIASKTYLGGPMSPYFTDRNKYDHASGLSATYYIPYLRPHHCIQALPR
jgi:hypothetical protein